MSKNKLKPNVNWVFLGKPEPNFSEYFKKNIVLHTTDGDLNDVITMRDKTTIYGTEQGWLTERDYWKITHGQTTNIIMHAAPDQAWKAQT